MPYALVTGASSGIGLHLARELAKSGYSLVLVARGARELDRVRDGILADYRVAVTVLTCDLAVSGAAAELYGRVRATHPVPDVVINNAGFGAYGEFHAADGDHLQRLIQVNVLSLTCLLRQVLPEMRAVGRGRIMNVASCAAFAPGPLMAVYFATKAYVLHLSEAVARECVGSGVTVTALCPGSTTTAFHRTAGFPEDSWLFNRPIAAHPARVARFGVAAMFAGRRVAIPGLANRLVIFAVRFIPRRLTALVAHRVLHH